MRANGRASGPVLDESIPKSLDSPRHGGIGNGIRSEGNGRRIGTTAHAAVTLHRVAERTTTLVHGVLRRNRERKMTSRGTYSSSENASMGTRKKQEKT